MKKIFGILMLALALVFAAGCVTTEDEFIGTWETAEPIVGDDYSYMFTLTFEADGTGIGMYDYSDGESYTYPLYWMYDEGFYWVEEVYSFKPMDDGSLVDWGGYVYERKGEGSGIVGTWTDDTTYDYGMEYVFNEDGTGTETYIYDDGDEYEYPIVWEEADGLVLFWYTWDYSWGDDTLTVGNAVYQYVEGDSYIREEGGVTSTLDFYENTMLVVTDTYEDGTVKYYYFQYHDEGDSAAEEGVGVLAQIYSCPYMIEDDGTLVCQDHGQRLIKAEA